MIQTFPDRTSLITLKYYSSSNYASNLKSLQREIWYAFMIVNVQSYKKLFTQIPQLDRFAWLFNVSSKTHGTENTITMISEFSIIFSRKF